MVTFKLSMNDTVLRQITFDQKIEQVGVSTNHGFIIFNCSITAVHYEARFPDGGANLISILSDSNIVACSGDDSEGGFMKSTAILWDKSEDKVMRAFDLDSDVIGIILQADALIIAYGDKISFYNSCDFEEYCNIKNPTKSLCSISLVQSIMANLVCFPAEDGNSINISDYHDPNYFLGNIILPSKISLTQFSRQGEMIAMASEDGKMLYLYSLIPKIQLVATYRRGYRQTEVIGLSFDSLSNYLLMITKRNTMHIFAIPTPSELKSIAPTTVLRSRITKNLTGTLEYRCQFDFAGYLISMFSISGNYTKFRLDLEKGNVAPVQEAKLQ